MMKYIWITALLVGCAHGKMGQVDAALDKGALSKSTPITVEPIFADHAEISGDKSGKPEVVTKIKQTIGADYSGKIADALRAKGYNAKAGSTGATGVVISGAVTKIENGSAAARYFGGFGAGSSKMFTDLKIEDRNAKKVLSKFQIIATSGGESGMGSYLDQHIKNAAKQIAEYIEKAQ